MSTLNASTRSSGCQVTLSRTDALRRALALAAAAGGPRRKQVGNVLKDVGGFGEVDGAEHELDLPVQH